MSTELALLGELLQLSRAEETSLEDFGNKVASSPHLAAEVVRVANSALYGMEGRITRLERAVLILGIRTVSAIASAVLVAKKAKSVKIGKLSGDAVWTHSLEIGVGAQLIARTLDIPGDSEAYLAGLLHDLGVIELFEEHGDAYAEVIARAGAENRLLHELEQEAFGTTHAEKLYTLAGEWGFPGPLQDALGFHHDPARATDESRVAASLVQAAHVLRDAGEWSDGRGTDPQVLTDLGISEDDLEDLRGLLDERIKEVASVFS